MHADSTTPPEDGPTIALDVLSMADRGMAMGRLAGKVVFVPLAAPGDRVEIRIVREHGSYFEARILRVLEASPLRREAPCPHFGTCGGCQWQHLPYSEQLQGKARSFEGLLRTRLGLDPERFLPPIPSPREWGYRNRVGLKVRGQGKALALGYFAALSHRIVSVEACPIAHPGIQELLGPLRTLLQGFGPAAGRVPQVDLQVDGHGEVWAVFHLLSPLAPSERRAVLGFAEDRALAGTFAQTGRKHTLTPLGGGEISAIPFHLEAGGRSLSLELSPGGFAQANWAVNQALVTELTRLSRLYEGLPALDVFCGSGNFTLPLALSASSVAAIEGYPPAAADAARNARRNGLENVRVLSRSAAEGLRSLAEEGFRPGFALLDPPRDGAREALGPVAALAPAHLLYVSCAPPTLARDLGILAGLGYRVEWTRLADMFPQTAHAESLTLLTRYRL